MDEPDPSSSPQDAAFTHACASLRPELLRFACWLCRDRQAAEDIVQESLLRAWASRGELRNLDATRPWLLTIVRRENARRFERRRLEVTGLDGLLESEAIDLAAEDDTEMVDLRRAILALPDDYREPLILQVIGGFATAEIARELNLSTSAVLTRLFRARNKLRAVYGLTLASDVTEEEQTP